MRPTAGDVESNEGTIEGFRRAITICGLVVGAGCLAGGLRIANTEPGRLEHTG